MATWRQIRKNYRNEKNENKNNEEGKWMQLTSDEMMSHAIPRDDDVLLVMMDGATL